MPVIAGGDDDGIDLFVIDHSSQIREAFGISSKLFFSCCNLSAIGIAKASDLDPIQFGKDPQMLTRASPATDEAHSNFVIRQ